MSLITLPNLHSSQVLFTVMKANWYRCDSEFFKLVSSKRSIRFFLQQGWPLLFISLLLCPHRFLLIATLHLQLSSFLRFFFLASTPGWQYFSSRLLHAISLKLIWVKWLAEVLALEEHQLLRAWKVLCLFHPGLSSGINPRDWIGWWRYIDLWEEMAIWFLGLCWHQSANYGKIVWQASKSSGP